MQFYKTAKGNYLVHEQNIYLIEGIWDTVINQENLYEHLLGILPASKKVNADEFHSAVQFIQAPIGHQELWAAGVTYLRSRNARMEEVKTGGGADFYEKVYEADRPELFFKSLPHRISAHGEKVFIRK